MGKVMLRWLAPPDHETAAKSERRRREVGGGGEGGRGGERRGRERGSTPLSTHQHLAIGLLHALHVFFFVAPRLSVAINARGNTLRATSNFSLHRGRKRRCGKLHT